MHRQRTYTHGKDNNTGLTTLAPHSPMAKEEKFMIPNVNFLHSFKFHMTLLLSQHIRHRHAEP